MKRNAFGTSRNETPTNSKKFLILRADFSPCNVRSTKGYKKKIETLEMMKKHNPANLYKSLDLTT